MKQNDVHTRMATARLVDDLSRGVCMIPLKLRMEMEALHFIESTRRPQSEIYALADLVWTKIAFMLGFPTPQVYNLPDEVNGALQKSFTDYLWNLGLEASLQAMGPEHNAAHQRPLRDVSAALNAGKVAHVEDHRSFQSVFLSEVRGILDTHEEMLRDLIRYLYKRDTGIEATLDQMPEQSGDRSLATVIYNLFQRKNGTRHFPSLRIGAGLHAAVRWDKSRRYNANDLVDFRHAMAALPYCDVFFTERALHHLLQDGNLRFDNYFSCKTAFRPIDALALLDSANRAVNA